MTLRALNFRGLKYDVVDFELLIKYDVVAFDLLRGTEPGSPRPAPYRAYYVKAIYRGKSSRGAKTRWQLAQWHCRNLKWTNITLRRFYDRYDNFVNFISIIYVFYFS